MAKAKAKTKKAAKKSAGERLPKTIAGVKVPKDLRSPAARAKRYVETHPVISEAVAAGMLAAAAALMADKAGKGGKAKTVLKAAASAVGGRLMAEAKLGLGGNSAAKPASGAKGSAAKSRTAKRPA